MCIFPIRRFELRWVRYVYSTKRQGNRMRTTYIPKHIHNDARQSLLLTDRYHQSTFSRSNVGREQICCVILHISAKVR